MQSNTFISSTTQGDERKERGWADLKTLRNGGQGQVCRTKVPLHCNDTAIRPNFGRRTSKRMSTFASVALRPAARTALLFVFQMPLWVRPLVYAQCACYNFPFTVGFWNPQRNAKLSSRDFVQFWMSNHHLVRVGKWFLLDSLLFPVIWVPERPI